MRKIYMMKLKLFGKGIIGVAMLIACCAGSYRLGVFHGAQQATRQADIIRFPEDLRTFLEFYELVEESEKSGLVWNGKLWTRDHLQVILYAHLVFYAENQDQILELLNQRRKDSLLAQLEKARQVTGDLELVPLSAALGENEQDKEL